MNWSLRDRHLVGAGAAACAVCCAAPIVTLLGLAGVAATIATFVLAGLVFGVVVAVATVVTIWHRGRQPVACEPSTESPSGPVDLQLGRLGQDSR